MAESTSFNGSEPYVAQKKPLGKSSNPERRLPTTAPTSCRRCRKHKLRCSKDLPSCKRCRDAKVLCDYPLPPDRKLLAAQRVQRAKLRRSAESGGDSQTNGHLSHESDRLIIRKLPSKGQLSQASSSIVNPITSDVEFDVGDHPLSTSVSGSVLKRTTLPSPEVSNFLFEVYFSRVYNASLLFHKRSFLAEYAVNKVPDFVYLSIFALASIFLGSSTNQLQHQQDEDEIDHGLSIISKSDAEIHGEEWATAASQRVLMQADVPRLETVQACQNLALYWFSRGQTERTHIHTYTAYRISRLLKLHLQHPNSVQPDTNPVINENKRRCFWSCWMTNCISQQNADFKSKPWEAVIGLSLPSDDKTYASSELAPTGNFTTSGNIASMKANVNSPPSPMGELVKLCDLWWQIHDHIRRCKEATSSHSNRRMFVFWELDQRLESIQENMHSAFKYNSASSFRSPENDPYNLFFIQSFYRLCACTLHSSVIPLFSELPSVFLPPQKAVRLSVRECVKHATFMLDMASSLLNTRPDLSRLPSLVGYAMFVASTVYFKTIVAQRRVQARTISRLKGAVHILESSKGYWLTNQALWTSLQKLLLSEDIDITSIASIQTLANIAVEDQNIDLDGIVSYKEMPQEKGRTGTDIYTYVKLQEDAKFSHSRASQDNEIANPTRAPSDSLSSGIIFDEAGEKDSQQVHSLTRRQENFHHNPNSTAITPPYEEDKPPPRIQYASGPEQFENRYPASHWNQDVITSGLSLDEISQVLRAGDNPVEGNMTVMGEIDTRMIARTSNSLGVENPIEHSHLAIDFGEEMEFWWDQSWQAFETGPRGLSVSTEMRACTSDFPYSYMI